MTPKPLNEVQVVDRLSYYASSGVSADAFPVANACRWLTRGSDDEAVIVHWSEILLRFTPSFKAAFPSGLRITKSTPANSGNIRGYIPGLVEALRLWNEAKSKVLEARQETEVRPSPLSSQVTSPSTSHRLIGGSAGEPDLTDEDDSRLSAAKPSPSNTLTLPTSQPRSEVTAPAYFPEVAVRPAKVTSQESAASSLIDSTALEAAERETAEVDSMLAAMLGADDATPQSINNPSR